MIGHYLLTLQLLPLLKKAPRARIVNVSSELYLLGSIHFDNINLRNGAYSGMKSYAQSKLANILFTRELAKRLGPGSTVTVYALNPGAVKTGIGRHANVVVRIWHGLISVNVEAGCQTTLYCALDESLDGESGFYYEYVLSK